MHAKPYPWALMGAATGDIDIHRGHIVAALVSGSRYNEKHKTVGQFLRAGGRIIATSTLIILPDGTATGEQMRFEGIPAGERIDTVLIYQASDAKGGPDLSPEEQRLCGYFVGIPGLPAPAPNCGKVLINWQGNLDTALNPSDPVAVPAPAPKGAARLFGRMKVNRER